MEAEESDPAEGVEAAREHPRCTDGAQELNVEPAG